MTLKKLWRMLFPRENVADITEAFTRKYQLIEEEEAELVQEKSEKIEKLRQERDQAQSELDKARKARKWLLEGLTGQSQ